MLTRAKEYDGKSAEEIKQEAANEERWAQNSRRAIIDLALRYRFGDDYDAPERIKRYFEPYKQFISEFLTTSDYISFWAETPEDLKANIDEWYHLRRTLKHTYRRTAKDMLGEYYNIFYLDEKPEEPQSSEVVDWTE